MRLTHAVLAGFLSLSLLLGTLQAASPEKLRDLKPEEIQKIKQAMPGKPTVKPDEPRKMLVFWRCEGFYHKSIPVVNEALKIMGKKTAAFEVTECTDDYSVFTPEKLRQFDAVCLNNTTHLKFDPQETPERCKALMDFVKGGKGIVGVHAATDNFYKWPEGMEMMGGKFTGHPWGGGGTWAIRIDRPDHPLVAAFEGEGFKVKDEIYRTDPPLYSRDKQLVLMSLDMSDPKTKARAQKPSDADTGISWIKTVGDGRVFYCSLGHNNEIFMNPKILQHYLDGIQFAFGDYDVDTTPKPPVSSGKGSEMEPKVQELLSKIKSYDWGQSRVALTEMSEIIRKAHGDKAELAKLEKALLGVLEFDAKRAGKQYVCRELSLIGTEQSVPVLAGMLTDQETSDMARYALERIGGEAVDEALRGALGKARGKAKIGIVNSLGRRGDEKAVRPLSRLVTRNNEQLAAAAAAALGRIATPQAAGALAEAKNKTEGKVRMAVLDAYLKCADRMLADGEKTAAMAIYGALRSEDMPKSIRTAATTGMLNAAKQ